MLWNKDSATLWSHFLPSAGGLLIETQYFYLFTNWQRRLNVRRCRFLAAFTRDRQGGSAQGRTEATCDNAGTSGRSRDSTIWARNWLVYKSICDVCVRHGKLDLKRGNPDTADPVRTRAKMTPIAPHFRVMNTKTIIRKQHMYECLCYPY